MYNTLGRVAVRYAFRYVRHRYRREIRIGAAVAVGAIAVGVYRATREVREG